MSSIMCNIFRLMFSPGFSVIIFSPNWRSKYTCCLIHRDDSQQRIFLQCNRNSFDLCVARHVQIILLGAVIIITSVIIRASAILLVKQALFSRHWSVHQCVCDCLPTQKTSDQKSM